MLFRNCFFFILAWLVVYSNSIVHTISCVQIIIMHIISYRNSRYYLHYNPLSNFLQENCKTKKYIYTNGYSPFPFNNFHRRTDFTAKIPPHPRCPVRYEHSHFSQCLLLPFSIHHNKYLYTGYCQVYPYPTIPEISAPCRFSKKLRSPLI